MESIVCGMSLARSRDGTTAGMIIPREMETLLRRSKDLLSSDHPLVSRLRFYDGCYGLKLINCIRKPDICLSNPTHHNRDNDRAPIRPKTPPELRSSSHEATTILLTAIPADLPPPLASRPRSPATTPVWLLKSGFAVPISAAETLALATILGIPLEVNDFTQQVRGRGAFHSSLDFSSSTRQISLSIGHTGSGFAIQGAASGYSTMMAKLIAFGCIPFAENAAWIKSVYVTSGVLEAVREGRAIMDVSNGYNMAEGASIEYLWGMPMWRDVDGFFAYAGDWGDASAVGNLLTVKGGRIWLEEGAGNQMTTATWQRAVAGIAFGGLVPQGSKTLVEAVAFTVGGTGLGGCVNELEGLLDDLHELDEELGEKRLVLYGEWVHERCRTKDSVSSLDVWKPIRWSTARAVVIFHRYMTLLELLAARCCIGGQSGSGDILEHLFRASQDLIGKVYVAAVKSHLAKHSIDGAPDWKLSGEETALVSMDLGETLSEVRARVVQSKGGINIYDFATVVRCILVAWACQVPVIPWNEEEIMDLELGPFSTSAAQPRARRLAVLADLPQVAGLS